MHQCTITACANQLDDARTASALNGAVSGRNVSIYLAQRKRAIAIVTSYMKNATLDSTIDREAMLDISAAVESMLLHDKEDWEI